MFSFLKADPFAVRGWLSADEVKAATKATAMTTALIAVAVAALTALLANVEVIFPSTLTASFITWVVTQTIQLLRKLADGSATITN